MLSSLLKIIPKLDSSALRAMEKTLQGRFTKLAKGFGKGLVGALKGGGIAGLALGLIDKLLNPIKEIQEAIERTLKSSDDMVTNAKQFNTSAGVLAKAVAIGKSTGLDQDGLFTLINKYQNAVAEAEADPNKPSAVRNYVGKDDAVLGFMEFMTALKGMEKNQQLLVQQQVFGEKQILKMADFLQTDLAAQYAKLGLNNIKTSGLTRDYNKLGGINDYTEELAAKTGLWDITNKARVITPSMAKSKDQADRIALQKENKRIASYENLAAISRMVEKIMSQVDTLVIAIGGLVAKIEPFITKVGTFMDTIGNSRFVRGIFGGGK